MRTLSRLVMALIVLLALVGVWGSLPASLQAQQPGQNLLTNPGFEPPYNSGVANGWAPWHEDSGAKCSEKPPDWDFVCQPSWSEELDYNNLGLRRSGSSQHVGAQYITWHGGVFQTVNAPPGSLVRFTVWGYGRVSNEQPPAPTLGTNWIPRMQVGIDPEGRGLWNTGVIWSGQVNAADSWQQLSVEATVGASGKVTVFVANTFRTATPVAHIDVWWDDASLVIQGPAPTATNPPRPTATPGPPPTPLPTATPRPDGAVVHVVQSGDTLYAIALQYNVSPDQIIRLNNLTNPSALSVGQELVISAPVATVAPQVTPTPEVVTPLPTTPPPVQGGSLCALVYNDRNLDTFRQADVEELLPGARITLTGPDGVALLSYVTDGLKEPYCFTGLANGQYRLSLQPPAGYAASGPAELAVMVSGAPLEVGLGLKRAADAAGTQAAPVTATPASSGGEQASPAGVTDILGWIVRISGILVLVLALIIGILFVRSRMR